MHVTTVVLDNAANVKMGEEGNFDLALGGAGYGGGTFDSAYYGNHFDCGRLAATRIRTGFCDEELDQKAKAMFASTDPAERARLVDEINTQLTEVGVPWVPLFGEAEVWAMQPYVNGFVGSPAGQMFDLWKITVDK